MSELKKLNGNELKIIAAVLMLIDHIGYILFPDILFLRIIGRLSFPIFAFFISEGCRYTKHKLGYFLRLLFVGVICFIGYYIFNREIYGNILITFSFSVLNIYVLQAVKKRLDMNLCIPEKMALVLVAAICFLITYLICRVIHIDYGFFGVMLPVFAELFNLDNKFFRRIGDNARGIIRLIGFAIGLIVLSLSLGGIQMFCIYSIIFIALYNGKRGKLNLKNFFYIFYPAHLTILKLISIFIDNLK